MCIAGHWLEAHAQAVAAEDGRAVSEVVSERWGSLSALTATLTTGRAAHGAPRIGVSTEPVEFEPLAVHD